MAWDKRGYYYVSRRVGRRVAREYYGKGPIAEEAVRIVERMARARADAGRGPSRQLIADESFRELGGRLDSAAAAEMIAAGYRRHDRGPWRKTRAASPDVAEAVPASGSEAGRVGASEESGDAPTLTNWATLRSLARAAREAWADDASGGDPADRALRIADLGRTATMLAGRGASPLLKLLATRSVLADARLAGERDRVGATGVGGGSVAATVRVRRSERAAAAAARSLGAARRVPQGVATRSRPSPFAETVAAA